MYFIKIPFQSNFQNNILKKVNYIPSAILHRKFSYLHSCQSFKRLIRHSFNSKVFYRKKMYAYVSVYFCKKKQRKNKLETRHNEVNY